MCLQKDRLSDRQTDRQLDTIANQCSRQVFSPARKTCAKEKHFYEIIPEGHACKLYFDIEFNRDLNPSCEGDHLVDILIEVMISVVIHLF